jgi:hypothetical protein
MVRTTCKLSSDFYFVTSNREISYVDKSYRFEAAKNGIEVKPIFYQLIIKPLLYSTLLK